ncbi:TIGR02710 family CRISPR-associated CARF protein [Methanobrevibacter olleyae]|uniref:CRISPR-associated protein TIGR02710 family n=1 Tax=Methanobrevibacter olleyae TaxID=294671 RepID=A0A126QYL5_METOL|nr:TIGR02710 family CRISPR-associated CARF protein [Methanobrevibacter olleyae]AMK15253.1 CRISPR-associated protein TIGR02710 family [Methanobrevibacter olleyae]SFL79946.1 CRISPR-associated protein, TIGR02710 family [Methanobrevibacter olleyae]
MSKEEILILTVGGSPEPLIYSINEFKPDNVLFLHSPETLKECSKIINETGFNESKVEYLEIKDAESLDDSFAVAKSAFIKFNDYKKYDVILDFTGGTKPMVSGVVLALIEGNYSNFRFSYVGSKDSESRDKNGVGVVKDGSEISKIQINPYKKYAITEFKRGKNFFNTYQFEAASLNFKCAKNRLETNVGDYNLASLYEEIVDFYQKWDKFNDKKSKKVDLFKYLKSIIEKIENDEYLLKLLSDTEFYEQLNYNLKFLSFKLRGSDIYIENDSDKALLKNRIQYYLSDLLNNAYRRIEEAKYDDAVARLYRINELIAQIKLCDYGLIEESRLQTQKVFIIDIEKTRNKARNKANFDDINSFINHNANSHDLKKGLIKLPNDKSFQLLELFGFVKDSNFEKLNMELKVRNDSILAHGLNPIKKEKAELLFRKILTSAKAYFPDLEEQMKIAEFPKFDF